MRYNSIALYNIGTDSWLHLATPKFGNAQYYWGEWSGSVYKLDSMYNKHTFITLLQTLVDHKMLEDISEGMVLIVPMKLNVTHVPTDLRKIDHMPVWADSLPLHNYHDIFT